MGGMATCATIHVRGTVINLIVRDTVEAVLKVVHRDIMVTTAQTNVQKTAKCPHANKLQATVYTAAKVHLMGGNVTGVFQVKREKIVQRTVLSSANSRNALKSMVLVAKDAVVILMGHIATSAILAFTGITVRAIVLTTVLI